MKRNLLYIFLILIFTSCKKESVTEKPKYKNLSTEKVTERKPKRIGDYISNEKDFIWSAKQSDIASYWVRITFQKKFASYQFHGQCYYSFFTNHYHTKADKIELLWTYKTDCLLDMKFFKNSNGIKKYPKNGDSFCEYTLVNDSVLKVKYNFTEWTEKINEIEKDSIFPKYLYLEKKAAYNSGFKKWLAPVCNWRSL